jgi:hypothetical protein
MPLHNGTAPTRTAQTAGLGVFQLPVDLRTTCKFDHFNYIPAMDR